MHKFKDEPTTILTNVNMLKHASHRHHTSEAVGQDGARHDLLLSVNICIRLALLYMTIWSKKILIFLRQGS